MALTKKTINTLFIIFLFSIQGAMAQQYSDMWKKYNDLENKGFNKDALSLAQKIYDKAQSENITEQKFKAIIHIYKNRMQIEENSEEKIVQDLKSKISNTSNADEKALLNLLLAHSYYSYYSDNQYVILDRTFSNELSDDFTMWDARQFQDQINSLYISILANKKSLKQYSLENFSSIINSDKNSKFSIPVQNLSDIIYLEAIHFYKAKNLQLIEASNAFQINQKEYFSPITPFSEISLDSESFSNELFALQLFQQWAKEHIDDSNKELLSYIDYERLRFVYENYIGENKIDLYVKSLETAFKQSTTKSTQSLFRAELIHLWYDNHEELNIQLNDIVQKATKHIQTYPDTYGAYSVQALLDAINTKNLEVKTEEFIPANSSFKAAIQYQNISSLQYKIIEWNPTIINEEYNSQEKIWKNIQKAPTLHTGTLALPASDDYLQHSIEYAFDGLPIGKYALITYTKDINTQFEKSKFTISPFQVSQLAVTINEDKQDLIFRVLDRKTGFPIQNISVEIQKSNGYNNQYQTIFSGFTNARSEVKIDKSSLNNSLYKIIAKSGKDIIEVNQQYYNYRSENNQKNWNYSTKIFTDRAIYRQGQDIYFKGILIASNGDTVQAAIQQTLKVTLRDANYQEVSSQTFSTNEFGSFSGIFKIPVGGLNGSFTIETPYGSASIAVEDYKRPTFEVEILPTEGTFQLESNIRIQGQAIAYSGANISNAEATYTVQRQAYYPIWRMYGKYFPQYSSPAIITTGKTATDANGQFFINFIAEKDRNNLSVYQYIVSVNVADITGEVRSTSYTLRVGKNAIEPQMNTDAVWEINTTPSLSLSAKNLQGVPVSTQFKVTISSLETPKFPKKPRYWEAPDQYSMTEIVHDKKFPYDIYSNDNSVEKWTIKAKIWERNIEVTGDTSYQDLPKNLSAGMYKISSVIIDNSDTIVIDRYFEVKAALAPSIQPEFIKVSLNKKSYQTNDIASIVFASDIPKGYVSAFFTIGNDIVADTAIYLNGVPAIWNIPFQIKNNDIVTVYYEMIAENRIFKNSINIPIQYKKWDDLDIKWQTFRNKLLPGSKEKWTLKITDKNQQLIEAELLATMYDASLDQFASNDFYFSLPIQSRTWYSYFYYGKSTFGLANSYDYQGKLFNIYPDFVSLQNPEINYFNWRLSLGSRHQILYAMRGGAPATQMEMAMKSVGDAQEDSADTSSDGKDLKEDSKSATPEVSTAIFRTNFNETAFFYPFIYSDKSGEYTIDFTIPDALTTWKFLAFAHTKELHYNIFQDEVKTQKDIMIQMNRPRFLREGDIVYLKAKVSNLTDKEQSISSSIVFRNADTQEDITSEILKSNASIQSTISAKGNNSVEWKIEIPKTYQAITYEILANSGSFSDGEKDIIPILENRILLTKSTPIFINKKGKYSWELKDFITQSASSNTKMIAFEYTSQPVWYALMALPYLNEQNEASALALFDRYYANTLASFILKEIPESKKLLEAWKKEGSLKSALEKNQELKSIVLEATPWLRDAQDETEQMQQLYKLLTDAENPNTLNSIFEKLQKLQNPSGGISWYPGMPESRYITQHILLGIYQLDKIGALKITSNSSLNQYVNQSINYVDNEVLKQFNEIKKYDSNYLKNDHLSYQEIQYLYLTSFFRIKINSEPSQYFYGQAQKFGTQKNNYAKALLAMTLNRYGDKNNAQLLLKSLEQSAVISEKEGMYWKTTSQYYWYDSPIETQASIILAFNEITKEDETIDHLKLWLLRQKQTNRWEQPKATVEACYALLLTGSDWKTTNTDIVKIDGDPIANNQSSLGTSYIKQSWNIEAGAQQPQSINIRKKKKTSSWGAIYQQYWEDLDKTESNSNEDLNIKRTLYKVENNEQGELLIPISQQTPLKIGDQIRIKLELKINKDLEFFHLQDTRASGFEPVNVLSTYKYQGGLWYYEVNGDAATHWFIENINKGNYVFEYTVNINVAGKYSSGVTSGECLYAPEYRFHSNGTIFEIKP
ncbi:MAG: MG2 domain-containing protein [Chitinophagales bacterium]|nr:MG2 domain-containing protein [Chitinophagales bacterium]